MSLRGFRVLMCHNSYRIKAGEDISTVAEVALLREAGAEVELYELSSAAISKPSSLGLGLRAIWSVEAYREVRRRLRAGRYDIVHVQNFFPLLSPSTLWAAHREGLTVIVTLRNFRLICIGGGGMFRNNAVCEACLGRLPYAGVWHRCYRGSLGASAAAAAMLVVHRMLGTWQRTVDAFITPSEFAKRKLTEAGLDASKIYVKPNFVHPEPNPGSGDGGFALYAGRLSSEKGIRTLLRAWSMLPDGPELRIVGQGPLEAEVRRAAAEMAHVSFRGREDLNGVLNLMGQAALVLVPSEWPEVFGRVAVEAFSVGTPVVASAIGGLQEIVVPDYNGVLVPPQDAEALAQTVRDLWRTPERLRAMREGARKTYEARYTGKRNLEILEHIYRHAIQAKS
ncbi:MAG: glycosyltransferase [Bacteroidota bacterium]|nr:glycosyltransferase [Bacteroidota bacterium]